MAVTDELAAQAARDALAKEIEGKFNIEDAYAQAREAQKANTQNILNQLTQTATDYRTQFGEDARSAYINKMQAGQKLEGELARLGLSNAGYGVTQRLMNESNYGTNLANLQKALNQNLTAIDQSKATAQTELGNTLANLALKQSEAQNSIEQYKLNLLQNAYDTAYNRSYQERQDEENKKLQYAQLAASRAAYKSTSNDNESTETSKKKWYVPNDDVKNFIKNAKILKTNDAKQNFVAMALAKGTITDNDLDYVMAQLGL